jgi:hypothetical protein
MFYSIFLFLNDINNAVNIFTQLNYENLTYYE